MQRHYIPIVDRARYFFLGWRCLMGYLSRAGYSKVAGRGARATLDLNGDTAALNTPLLAKEREMGHPGVIEPKSKVAGDAPALHWRGCLRMMRVLYFHCSLMMLTWLD